MMKRLGITRVDIRRVAPDCRSGSPGGVRGRERHGGERIGRPKASVRGPHRANGYYRSPQTIRGVLCSEGRRATSALLWPAFNRISISCRFSIPNILLSLRRRTLLDTVVCCHLVHCFAATRCTSLLPASPDRTARALPGENLAKFRIGGDCAP